MDERILKTISDRHLKDILLLDGAEFEEGAHARYLDEARRRNIDLAFMDAMTPEIREHARRKRVITWGWTTSCAGSLFGLILGLYIRIAKDRNNPGHFRFDRKTRAKGIFMMMITAAYIALWFCLRFRS